MNLVFTTFANYRVNDLVRLERYYLLICWIPPAILSLLYYALTTSGRVKIFGSAVLWCWISGDYAYLRMATFYAPVWYGFLSFFFHISVSKFRWLFLWLRHFLNKIPIQLLRALLALCFAGYVGVYIIIRRTQKEIKRSQNGKCLSVLSGIVLFNFDMKHYRYMLRYS